MDTDAKRPGLGVGSLRTMGRGSKIGENIADLFYDDFTAEC